MNKPTEPGVAGADQILWITGWRWVFLSVVPLPPIAVLCVLPSLRALGPTGGGEPVRARLISAALLTAGAAEHGFNGGLRRPSGSLGCTGVAEVEVDIERNDVTVTIPIRRCRHSCIESILALV